ncbi:MAG: ABC transporter permease [Acidimicrobiia bacterium]|nr:ABC transporter permease [Acidimicrobiia bacterium]MDH4309099.1 ABC transporter permease [Acidimicrobiia bacterium]
MRIAFKDIWRSKLRFSLLAGAVGLLFFLLLFLNTLSSTLLGSFVGAIENGSADVIVFAEEAQATIPGSRLDESVVGAVAEVSGVVRAEPISELTTRARIGTGTVDVSVWGVTIGGPGTPPQLAEGRLPQEAGEAVVDRSAFEAGAEIGELLEIGNTNLKVVAVADDATYAVTPTIYTDHTTWASVFAGEYPEAGGFAPTNLVGAIVDAEPAEVAAAITAAVDGVEAFDRQAAAAATPGVSSISQSFGLIVGITFVIVVVVVGFFFQILTVQKLKAFAVLKAIGASGRSLAGIVAVQIVAMVGLGVIIGTGFLAATAVGTRDVFAIGVDYRLVAVVGAAVVAFSLIAGVFPIGRVIRQEAATAAMGGSR